MRLRSLRNLWAPLGGRSSAPPFYAENPWLMLGYNATVALELDTNAAGGTVSRHGVREPRWRPVARWGAVRCILSRRRQEGTAGGVTGAPMAPRHEQEWRAIFGRPIALDLRHRLVVADPARGGFPRYLYVQRPTRDAFLKGIMWAVELAEQYNPRG